MTAICSHLSYILSLSELSPPASGAKRVETLFAMEVVYVRKLCRLSSFQPPSSTPFSAVNNCYGIALASILTLSNSPAQPREQRFALFASLAGVPLHLRLFIEVCRICVQMKF
jgi:hypothetical protein